MTSKSTSAALPQKAASSPPIPQYLSDTYWWAYLHPTAVKIFERQWLVNCILWGNFTKLRDLALSPMGNPITGKTLQIACVYGDFTPHIETRLSQTAHLDVVDVAPIQLSNLQKKLAANSRIKLHHQNAANLSFRSDNYDNVILFFLLHEVPEDTRRTIIQEALRVMRPGGKLIIVDYHKPHALNPIKWVMIPILKLLEPFALGLWQRDISDYLTDTQKSRFSIEKSAHFGGLYQRVVIQ